MNLRHFLMAEADDLNAGGGDDDKPDLAKQLAEANTKLQEEAVARARAEGEAEALKRVTPPPEREVKAPPKYSRTQLNSMVAANQLTQAEADEYYDLQLRREVTQEVTTQVTQTLSQKETGTKLQEEIDAYQAAFPDSMKAGSVTRQKISTEYNRMVKDLGFAKGAATELAAAKAILGALPKSGPRDVTRGNRETHQDTGGSGDFHEEGRGNDPKDPVAKFNLQPREKAHYQRLIDMGMHKNWEEVADLLKTHSNPITRKKYNAMSA